MISYDDILLAGQMRRNSLEAEAQQERWARLAAAGRSQLAREPGIRRMAVRLGDFVAELRCLWESHFASEPAAMEC
jgi:hypothetical protein